MPALSAVPFDPDKYIERYHQSSKGELLPGLDDVLEDHSHTDVVKTVLLPAPWKHVLFLAIIYAFAINTTKQIIYFTVGRPDIRPATEDFREPPRPIQPKHLF
jgi:hypothetical protein